MPTCTPPLAELPRTSLYPSFILPPTLLVPSTGFGLRMYASYRGLGRPPIATAAAPTPPLKPEPSLKMQRDPLRTAASATSLAAVLDLAWCTVRYVLARSWSRMGRTDSIGCRSSGKASMSLWMADWCLRTLLRHCWTMGCSGWLLGSVQRRTAALKVAS